MKRIILTALAIAFTLIPSQQAFAHVLGEDASGKRGALLHIMPDDNPTVGQDTTIYFDLQGYEDEAVDKATLDVVYDGATLKTLDTTLKDTTVSVQYTFDSTGTYELKLTVQTSDDKDTFSFNQVVSGPQMSLGAQLAQYWWAIALLILASAGIGVLIVLFVVKRKDIAKRSVGV